MLEEDENFINNKKQKKQQMAFSQKIEEIISEYKNRKKFGIPKIKEDNLQNVDLKQYNEFLEQIEEHKTIVNKYKIKLNNDMNYESDIVDDVIDVLNKDDIKELLPDDLIVCKESNELKHFWQYHHLLTLNQEFPRYLYSILERSGLFSFFL